MNIILFLKYENHQNCLNQTQRRKKSITSYFFISKASPHFWPYKRGPETKHCTSCGFHLLGHFWNNQANAALFSFCMCGNDRLTNPRAECKMQVSRFQLTGRVDCPRHSVCSHPAPSLPLSSPTVVQEYDAHKRKIPGCIGPKIQWLLSLPSLELWAREQGIQPHKVNSNWLRVASKSSDKPTKTEPIQQDLLHYFRCSHSRWSIRKLKQISS